jgi:arsenate reductase
MAEGWAKVLVRDAIDSYSAGVSSYGLDPDAVLVMKECGVDISDHSSKHVDELMSIRFDYVITVCGHAHETCPLFPGSTKVIHVGFDDPPRLAEKAVTRDERLTHYRRVRDEIRDFVMNLPEYLKRL